MTYIEYIKKRLKLLVIEQRELKRFVKLIKTEIVKNQVYTIIYRQRDEINYFHILLEKEFKIVESNHKEVINNPFRNTKKEYECGKTIKENDYNLYVDSSRNLSILKNNLYGTMNSLSIAEQLKIEDLKEIYIIFEKKLIDDNKEIKPLEKELILKKEIKNIFHSDVILEKYSPIIKSLKLKHEKELKKVRDERKYEYQNSKEYLDFISIDSSYDNKNDELNKRFDNFVKKYFKDELRLKKLNNII